MCANVFVCRVPLGVLFIGLPWVFPDLHPQFMCIVWFPECNVPHVTVHARCKRHKISSFSLLVSNNSDDCRHLKVISNITKQPFEPTKTPALDDSSALVSQRHLKARRTLFTVPAAPPIPQSGDSASTGFPNNQLSSALCICCQTVPDNG